MRRSIWLTLLAAASCAAPPAAQAGQDAGSGDPEIPLPEHPRPDFMRDDWVNLNGTWQFQFDAADEGRAAGWTRGLPSAREIVVPFPWGSARSGVPDEAQIGWYSRVIEVPDYWAGERVFLVIGASDWHTTAWLDGQELGTHQGGYTPFEFELTPHVRPGEQQRLVIRVDDVDREFTLEGKQGYGDARGIWQTPYLEARGATPLRTIHLSPDIDRDRVRVEAYLLEPAPTDLTLSLEFPGTGVTGATQRVSGGSQEVTFEVPIPDPHLWSLDDPYLYPVVATLGSGEDADEVSTYFGMRKISVLDLPRSDIPYVALNGEPVYLQLALDQAYHPEGFYTFPSDEFTRNEILRAKQIGLNGVRVHIKVPLPRKLYWADRLGMLVMEDLPNFWSEPVPEAREESETTLRRMIERDYNHPSVFSWIAFNETWGLRTEVEGREVYLPETKEWVVSMVELAKELDPTRLVEDNSVCCDVGHTMTDLNTWHAYLPGWEWNEYLATMADSVNFEEGYDAVRVPNVNSEFGNVWGYEGSTGDVDYSWDYHRAIEAFRRHPEIAGWLYTEHHDVINEWNGYWKYDRSDKITGLDALVDGMSLEDLHAPLYVAVGEQLSQSARPGQIVSVPLYASFLSGSEAYGDELTLQVELWGWNSLGQERSWSTTSHVVPYRPWMTEPLEPLSVTMPDEPAVAVLAVRLEDAAGQVLHRNFTTFIVEGETPEQMQLDDGRTARVVQIDPADFTAADWSLEQWNVLEGRKVNGAGSGFFEYRVAWPGGLDPASVQSVSLVAELGSKQLFGKDRDDADAIEGDYMRGRGTLDSSRNPNAYPMTDLERFPSAVTVMVNRVRAGRRLLEDDPADSRGILSWHNQLRDRRLREAGSYGQLVSVALPPEALKRAAADGEIVLRLEVDDALPGGLAIYGKRFGRYPLDPTLIFVGAAGPP